jgi:hypothetical protein
VDRQPDLEIQKAGTAERVFHFCVAREWMRTNHSGLRIGDAVTCARERLVGSKLFLYQAKTQFATPADALTSGDSWEGERMTIARHPLENAG